MHTGTNQSGHSRLEDIIYCCTIFLSGYRFSSEVGQVRLWSHHEFSSHAHSNVRRGYMECNKDGHTMRSAFATQFRTQLAAFSMLCVVTTKNTQLLSTYGAGYTYTHSLQFLAFPPFYRLPTLHYFCSSVVATPKASSLRKNAHVIVRVENIYYGCKFYASFHYDSDKIQPYRKYKK